MKKLVISFFVILFSEARGQIFYPIHQGACKSMIAAQKIDSKPKSVPIDSLLSNPKKYDDVYISLKGYLRLPNGECGYSGLFLDPLDGHHDPFKRTFVFAFSPELDTSVYMKHCFDGKYVQVDGNFDAHWAKDWIRAGAIFNINRIQIVTK